MQPEKSTNNQIFKNAFIGVLLFVATFGFTVMNRAEIDGINSTTIVAAVLGLASMALIGKAVKDESNRDQDQLSGI
jgi:hypothetical protein